MKAFAICILLWAAMAMARADEPQGIAELRGFSEQNLQDLQTLAERDARKGNPAVSNVLHALLTADLNDLPIIVGAMKSQIKHNEPVLDEFTLIDSVASVTNHMSTLPGPDEEGRYAAQVQASRATLMRSASAALGGNAVAYARIVDIGKRLQANRMRVFFDAWASKVTEFRSDDATFDPRHNDPEVAAARFLSASLSVQELLLRQRLLVKRAEPSKLLPRDQFVHDMTTFYSLASTKFGVSGYRLFELMDMIFLPDVAELPTLIKMASEHIEEKKRGALLKIAQDAQALADTAKEEPGVLLLDIQRRRYELAAKGAAAANGDAAALAELNELGARAYAQPIGKRGFELLYLYRSEGDKIESAARGNLELGLAAVTLATGVFTVADAREAAANYQTYYAENKMSPGRESLLECFVRQQEEKVEWQGHYCHAVPTGQDASGRPIYGLDCGSNVFRGGVCRQ